MNFKFKDNPFFWLLVAGLATWRITSILHREQIAAPVRKAVGIMPVSEDEDDPMYWIYPETFLGKLFYCPWCLSVWVGAGVLLLLLVFPVLIIPFALSAITIGIYKIPELVTQLTYYEEEYEENDGAGEN